MIRSTGPLYVFILSALAPDPLPIKIQPVLVTICYQYCSAWRPVLVTSPTSTGWKSDLYRFVDEAQEVDSQTTTGLRTSDYCSTSLPR